MSSSNDIYHSSLFVQAQPKSILKKSSSPKFVDTSIESNSTDPILSSPYEVEKDGNIAENLPRNEDHVCILNDNQLINNDNSSASLIEIPLNDLSMISNEIIRTLPRADSSSPLTLTSDDDDDDEHDGCVRFQAKKTSHRSFVNTGTLSSSSSDNDKRRTRRPTKESKSVLLRSSNQPSCPTDMQLDEFIRKYQQEGGILLPTKEDCSKERITSKRPINHRQQ